MARWGEMEAAAPDVAASIRGRFESHLHHVLGTLTAAGAPRLSGTEVRFHAGDVWLGCMPSSLKAKDLRRDSRFALHSAPTEVEMTAGDAKLSGVVEEITDREAITAFMRAIGHGDDIPEGETIGPDVATAFVCEIESATLTRVAGDHLTLTTWTPTAGVVERHVS